MRILKGTEGSLHSGSLHSLKRPKGRPMVMCNKQAMLPASSGQGFGHNTQVTNPCQRSLLQSRINVESRDVDPDKCPMSEEPVKPTGNPMPILERDSGRRPVRTGTLGTRACVLEELDQLKVGFASLCVRARARGAFSRLQCVTEGLAIIIIQPQTWV